MTNHLLSITIGEYLHWRPLQGPARDGDALLEVLFERYGFAPERIRSLTGAVATARNIRATLSEWVGTDEATRRERVAALGNDDLLIYYAGHGHWDEVSQSGYWIPHNGGTDVHARENWLPHSELLGYLASLPFRHVLLICDACFAGHMLKRDLGVARERQQTDFPAQAARYRSREALTSIGGETTPDVAIQGHSAFAFHLLDILRHADDPWLDKLSLYDRIRRGVPKAQCGDMEQAGHQQGGAFIFRRDDQSRPVTASSDKALSFASARPAQAARRTSIPEPLPPPLPSTVSPARPEGMYVSRSAPAEWYFLHAGHTEGPFSLVSMGGFLQNSIIDSDTLAWKRGWFDWHPVSSVAELMLEGMRR